MGVDAALVKIVSRFFFGQTPIMTSFMGIFITCFLTVCNMVNAQGTFQFRADIRGANEVPPVITWLTGFGRMTLDGNIFTASVFLVPPSSTTGGFINGPAGPGSTAPMIFDLGEPSFVPVVIPPDQSGQEYFISINLTSTQISQLMGGQWYVNITSAALPDGEIRGQIIPVPEPSAMLLLCAGAGAAGVRRFRKRGLS